MRPASLALPLLAVLAAGCLGGSAPAPSGEGLPQEAQVALPGARFSTSLGSFTMVLYPEHAPRTVGLVQALVGEGYYETREFGRVVPGHVIQVTDPLVVGLTDDPRRVPVEVSERAFFSAGAVGIARSDDPDSGGGSFFVMDYATSHLHGNYTVFGQVVEGLEVVRAIARVEAVEAPRLPLVGQPVGDRRAVEPVRIQGAELVEVRLPIAQAARLPMVVGPSVREGDYRYTLEWPADLAAGSEHALTWYVRPFNGSASLEPGTLRAKVEGPGGEAWVPLEPHPAWQDLLGWRWVPAEPGAYRASLLQGGRALAVVDLEVPAEPRGGAPT